jgi:micrococcal nuclease
LAPPRRLLPVVVLLLAALAITGLARWRDSRASLVRDVVDGDTLVLATGERVRLLGIDAPERDGPYTRAEPLGEAAAAFLRSAAEGRHVRLEFDAERRDRFARTLAYVYVDDLDVNAALLREGLARAYRRFPHRRLDEFLALEREARAARRGLWVRGGSAAAAGGGAAGVAGPRPAPAHGAERGPGRRGADAGAEPSAGPGHPGTRPR